MAVFRGQTDNVGRADTLDRFDIRRQFLYERKRAAVENGLSMGHRDQDDHGVFGGELVANLSVDLDFRGIRRHKCMAVRADLQTQYTGHDGEGNDRGRDDDQPRPANGISIKPAHADSLCNADRYCACPGRLGKNGTPAH